MHPDLLREYLAIRRESLDAYATRLGAVLGHSVRRLFDHAIAKPVTLDNTSSEGELMDFEHVWNGWFWGQPMHPCYGFEALYAMCREFPLLLRDATPAFEHAFAATFADTRPGTGDRHARAAHLLAAYLRRLPAQDDLLAPVADPVKAEMLARWHQTLGLYERLARSRAETDQAARARGVDPSYLLDNIDTLIAMVRDDIERMQRRRGKHVNVT